MRVLGAPQRVVASSRASRLQSDPMRVDVIQNGLIPLCAKHQIKTFDASSDYLFNGWKAGVYDQDRNVCAASLIDRDFTDLTVAFAPDEIDVSALDYIPGEAIYAGALFKHFGHFLLESTPRLWWPLMENFKGPIVFQSIRERPNLPRFAARFFELLGIADRIIVATRGLRFDRVIVPDRALTIRKAIHKNFQVPFLLAGAAAEKYALPRSLDIRSDAAGVYLSRTLFRFRRSFGEKRIERAFAREGYNIVYTETLPLEHQILIMRRHKAMAGIAGSAFHNILFSDESKDVTYICKDYDINENFFMIDELMQNASTYIYNFEPGDAEEARTDREIIAASYKADADLDVRKILDHLEDSGVLFGRR